MRKNWNNCGRALFIRDTVKIEVNRFIFDREFKNLRNANKR